MARRVDTDCLHCIEQYLYINIAFCYVGNLL